MTSILLATLLLAGPDEAQTLLEATEAHVAAGELVAAHATALEAVLADPENVDALWAAALTAFKVEENTEAATFLNTLIRLDPWDDDARVLLAQVQVRRGEREVALQNLDAVLDANPAYQSALELKEQLVAPKPGEANPWRHFVRAGVGTGWDSNVGLTADGLPDVSRHDAVLGTFELTAGAMAPTAAVPLTVLATMTGQTSVNDRDETSPLIPSTAGLAISGRIPVQGAEAVADLRYTEVFTDLFQTHYERQVSPSLSLSPAPAFGHRVRLLLGGDFSALDLGGTSPRAVLKATLRDNFQAGRLSLLVEAGGRRRTTNDNTGVSPGRFSEARGLVYAEAPLIEHLALFVLASGEARKFDEGLKESTYLAQGGVRYSFDPFEVHAEYGYSSNLSGKLRSYDRQQVGLGLRFWYF